MLTAVAFLVALGLLIAVHEYGHYRIAVACGVKVLRFSMGFGRPLLRWTSGPDRTEFVLALLPLGGYVRMLDEREGPVQPQERHRAFNNQSLRAKALVVVAGPAANLLLAVVLYAALGWMGVREPLPVLGAPEAGSLAAHAGLRAGDVVASAGESAESQTPVASFEQLRWAAVQAALAGQDLWVTLAQAPAAPSLPPVRLPLSLLDSRDADERLMHRIGLLFPYSAAVIGEIQPGAAAERAGLRTGDRVHAVDGRPVDDAHQLRQMIRQGTAPGGEPVSQRWRVQRDGQSIDIEIFPVPQRQKDGTWWGRIGAFVGAEPAMTVVRQGPWDGAVQAFRKVGEISVLSLNMMGRMVVGDASLKNLSGPLTIADHAGRSAQVGWTAYLSFLALISVSLGVLNLLPLPVLDGGHLMYYLWEGVTGRPVSEVWMDRLQRAGVVLLMGMMALALFNDLARYLG